MFRLFKKNSTKSLSKKYDKTMEEAFILSRSNRRMADQKYAEAERILEKIEALKASG